MTRPQSWRLTGFTFKIQLRACRVTGGMHLASLVQLLKLERKFLRQAKILVLVAMKKSNINVETHS
jgi:hypothetical protein